MYAVTHKLVPYSLKTLRFALLCMLVVSLSSMVLPQMAGAAERTTQVVALTCGGKKNNVIVKDNTVSCTVKAGIMTVQGVGNKSEATESGYPYPDEVDITTVVVSCTRGTPIKPRLGTQISGFQCSDPKGSLRIRKQNVDPNPRPAAKNPTVSKYTRDSSGKLKGGDDISGGQNAGSNICGPDGKQKCTDPAADPNAKCNLANGCDLVAKYVNPTIRLLTYVFALIATISIIMGGIQYAASTGDPQKVTAAKKRITNTIIAIVAYFFLYGFLQFLVPGGIFNRG